jgi:UrcA family protein
MRGFATLCLAAAFAAPSIAQTETVSVTVRHINLHPTTAAEAQHAFARINEAALRVCGASDFSLREVKQATQATPCWQDAFNGAVRQIANPALAQAVSSYRAAP